MLIKEGVDYSVGELKCTFVANSSGISFVVENEIVSGLRFLQVVKRAGVTGTFCLVGPPSIVEGLC